MFKIQANTNELEDLKFWCEFTKIFNKEEEIKVLEENIRVAWKSQVELLEAFAMAEDELG